jgi:hypothetical protein
VVRHVLKRIRIRRFVRVLLDHGTFPNSDKDQDSDPDPALFFSGFKTPTKKEFFLLAFYLLC